MRDCVQHIANMFYSFLKEQQQQSLLYSDQNPTYSMNVFARALIHNLERDLEGTQHMQSNLEWVEDM